MTVTLLRCAVRDDRHMSPLPPGPRWPKAVQTLAWWSRALPFYERCRATYGPRFTMRVLGAPPFVHITDPDEIRQLFTAPPEILHPGEGAKILEPVVGSRSVLLLDEKEHLAQRRLLLPGFHGERMQALTGLVEEVADRTVAQWPRDTPVALHEPLQQVTLEIILRAVFGLDPGPRLDQLRALLTEHIRVGAGPVGVFPPLQRDLGPRSPGGAFARTKAAIRASLRELVDERRAEAAASDAGTGAGRSDILATLLDATHEDGTPMSFDEIHDELMTALVAGHETTASQLAWTFTRLAHEPGVVRELTREVDAGDGEAYLTATINESLRRRPVLPNAQPRMTTGEYELGGWTYPAGVALSPNAYLVHHDPALYPDPYAFRPERFLEGKAGSTYTFIPFGGGRRRCLGAAFAQLEMRVVLKAVLREAEIRPAHGDGRVELARRRSITLSPKAGRARGAGDPRGRGRGRGSARERPQREQHADGRVAARTHEHPAAQEPPAAPVGGEDALPWLERLDPREPLAVPLVALLEVVGERAAEAREERAQEHGGEAHEEVGRHVPHIIGRALPFLG